MKISLAGKLLLGGLGCLGVSKFLKSREKKQRQEMENARSARQQLQEAVDQAQEQMALEESRRQQQEEWEFRVQKSIEYHGHAASYASAPGVWSASSKDRNNGS